MNYLLSLGSNKGDSLNFLRRAVSELKMAGDVKKISSLYKTEPVGYLNQDDFLNIMLEFVFIEKPQKLLEIVKKIEVKLGREKVKPWGPREIDIDIIDYPGPAVNSEFLKIPHTQMSHRKFVLIPLREIKPLYLARDGRTINQLIADCKDEGRIELLTPEEYGTGWI
jgi:2-amino-4-hydroxy-6-hydroxymethyldihydropteridine diphosphokinase